jgi:hypothetical protein
VRSPEPQSKGLFKKLPDPADHPVFRIEIADRPPSGAR